MKATEGTVLEVGYPSSRPAQLALSVVMRHALAGSGPSYRLIRRMRRLAAGVRAVDLPGGPNRAAPDVTVPHAMSAVAAEYPTLGAGLRSSPIWLNES